MIKSSNLNNILTFFGELGNPTVVVCDETISIDFLNKFSILCPEVILTNIQEIDRTQSNLTDETIIFYFSLKSEKILMESCQKAKIDINKVKRVYFVIRDILPRMIALTGIDGKYKQNQLKLDDLEHNETYNSSSTYYAIMCTPRSGSSFLCSLLRNNELGLPKEHLRNEPFYLMKYRKNGGFDLTGFFETVVVTGTKNKYFGTKIISHFLEDVLKIANDKERAFFHHNWIEKFKYIYLYRSDKVLQAISIYRAQKTKLWHHWAVEQRVKETIEYNFQEIENWYDQIIEQEKQLLMRIQTLKHQWNCEVEKVNYEELVTDSEEVMLSKIFPFLNHNDKKGVTLEAISKQIHGDPEKEIAEEFENEYKRQYSKRPIRNFKPSNSYDYIF